MASDVITNYEQDGEANESEIKKETILNFLSAPDLFFGSPTPYFVFMLCFASSTVSYLLYIINHHTSNFKLELLTVV